MTPFRLALPALLAAIALAAPLNAQPAANGKSAAQPRRVQQTQPTGAAGNAALTYYSVWIALGEADMKTINELYPDSGFARPLPQELHRVVTDHQAEIKRLIKSAAVKDCDFGLDHSEGFMMVLPHLAKMRTLARLLGADARRCVAEGKMDEAADRYAAMFGLARHASQDRVLISSLVSVAIASVPSGDLVEQNGAAMMTPQGRGKILAAIERMNGAEGFNIKEAIQGERDLAVTASIEKYTGPDAGRRFADECLKLGVVSPNGVQENDAAETKAVERIRQMDGASLAAELHRLDAFYDEVGKAWGRSDAQQRLKELSDAASRGDYGVFGGILLPALTKCHLSEQKGVENLRNLAAALRKAEKDASEAAKDGQNSK